MNGTGPWRVERGDGPIVAVALHAGHALRPEVAARMRLSDAERLREEDPFTAELATAVPTRVIAERSRFEVDLNRPRAEAVYLQPGQAWGLDVWSEPPPPGLVIRSLDSRACFYRLMTGLLEEKARRWGRFVVFDIHSYNHRRNGPRAPASDARENPDVNVGTGSMDRTRWGHVVDRFMSDLRGYGDGDRTLDVRENVRFRGGWFSRWVHERFPASGCAIAIEFKKTFMDEWTGEVDPARLDWLVSTLASTVPGVVQALDT